MRIRSPELLKATTAPRVIQCSSRYAEVETIGAEIADLLDAGADPGEIAVVVRHIDTYGEMIEDVFARYGMVCTFETGAASAENSVHQVLDGSFGSCVRRSSARRDVASPGQRLP